MKKITLIVLAITFMPTLFTACKSGDSGSSKTTTVIFEANGGWFSSVKQTFTGLETVPDGGYGKLLNDGIIPTCTGYIFTCWNTRPDGYGTNYDASVPSNVTADLTLYAMWTPITVTITFDANGGLFKNNSSSAIQLFTGLETIEDSGYGKLLNEGVTPTRNGYTFRCWNTERNGNGTSYAANKATTVGSDETLYAIWNPR